MQYAAESCMLNAGHQRIDHWRGEADSRAMVLIVPKGIPSRISPTISIAADFAQKRIAMNPATNTRAICTRTTSWRELLVN